MWMDLSPSTRLERFKAALAHDIRDWLYDNLESCLPPYEHAKRRQADILIEIHVARLVYDRWLDLTADKLKTYRLFPVGGGEPVNLGDAMPQILAEMKEVFGAKGLPALVAELKALSAVNDNTAAVAA